ncbi:MAG TPA: ABC transporter permease [Bryobacteraceae bacterium]|nr:ABC transporter permease [Bryobacteraceae bacterium]
MWLDHLAQDVRYGLRVLRRNPAFCAVTVLTLALGIGVNTAVFSVVNAVLLRPLPYPDAARLMAYSDEITRSSIGRFKPGIPGADFAEWRSQAQSFDGMTGYYYSDATLASSSDAFPIHYVSIAGDFWAMTGARPATGSLFDAGAPPNAVVLSHHFFEQRFRGDTRIIGQALTLDGQPMTVIGVLPPGFEFLFPQDLSSKPVDAYVPAPPLGRTPQQRRTLLVVTRLKPGISAASALAELRTIETRIQTDYPDRWFAGITGMNLVPLRQKLVGNVRQALTILQIAGLFVLLIACANIANLLLARAAAREREIAIRCAIGAAAGRILRQFLAEGLVLALLGGGFGLILASSAIDILTTFATAAVPRLSETHIDAAVLAFTAMLALASGVIFSFAPAIGLGKVNPRQPQPSSSFGMRRVLVAVELALAIVLLTGASLMIKGFWRMYATPPGFSPENTLVMKVSLSGTQYADKARQVSYLNEVVHRIESLPGVRAAGIAKTDGYLLQSANSARPPVVDSFQESLVSPGYFAAIGMRLLRGRWLVENDSSDSTIINETMARRAFGNADPIGQRIERLGRPVHVVGVVENLKYSKLDADPGPEIYRSYTQNLGPGRVTANVVVRIPGDPLGVAPAARKLVSAIDPTQPVYDVETLQRALSQSIAPRRFNLFLLGSFAAAAFLMAVIGIYGVVAYSVSQRTREIGIRMALGAPRSAVVGMVVRQGMGIAFAGIVAGIGAALGLTRFMASLLYEVRPNDPATFAVVAVLLALTAALACWGPALKAALIDPLIALRHE